MDPHTKTFVHFDRQGKARSGLISALRSIWPAIGGRSATLRGWRVEFAVARPCLASSITWC